MALHELAQIIHDEAVRCADALFPTSKQDIKINMTKDEIFDAITLEQMDGGYRFSPAKLATFLEKLWNKPCACHQERVEEKRWKPGKHDKYLFILVSRGEATVEEDEWDDMDMDYDQFKAGNCYPLSARTEVQKRCDEINAIIKKEI